MTEDYLPRYDVVQDPRQPGATGERPLCASVSFNEFWQVDTSAALRKLCRACPVLAACREWAIEHEEEGFWGGMSASERRRERAQRKLDRAARRRSA
jgi:sulfatase maturation enzyme AslB (radical SAM superfamily)